MQNKCGVGWDHGMGCQNGFYGGLKKHRHHLIPRKDPRLSYFTSFLSHDDIYMHFAFLFLEKMMRALAIITVSNNFMDICRILGGNDGDVPRK